MCRGVTRLDGAWGKKQVWRDCQYTAFPCPLETWPASLTSLAQQTGLSSACVCMSYFCLACKHLRKEYLESPIFFVSVRECVKKLDNFSSLSLYYSTSTHSNHLKMTEAVLAGILSSCQVWSRNIKRKKFIKNFLQPTAGFSNKYSVEP